MCHPWALVDFSAPKVPENPGTHCLECVTVAVLVFFPPQSFYFPNAEHINSVLRYLAKMAGKSNSVKK